MLTKEKLRFEEQLTLKERELNRIENEFKEEKTTLAQKIVFAEMDKENVNRTFERKMSELEITKVSEIQSLKSILSEKVQIYSDINP